MSHRLSFLMLTAFTVCLYGTPEVIADDKAVISVPESIPADLSRDVTTELNRFFAGLPDGTSVRFPAQAKYRIEGTIVLADKTNITIDRNGVLFRAVDRGEDHGKKENYAGWKRTRNRAHLRVKGGRNIQIRNVEVHGAHPDAGKAGTYDSNREAQHGFDLVGVKDCILDNVNVHDVYGDCVYLTKVQGVVVRNSKLRRCGRQGIAVATGEDVLIENNEIADSRRGIIDIEPYGKDWATGNIRIIGNKLGGSRLLLLPMGGSGTIGTIFIADNVNTEPNGTPAVSNTGKSEQHRGPFLMINNQISIGGSPAAGLRIRHNDGIFLAGNTLTFPERRQMTALDLEGSSGAVVGNKFEGAAAVGDVNQGITRLFNSTASDAKPTKTEWKRIPGGFAVKVTLEDGEVVALMRGGPRQKTPPKKIEGYGHSTEKDFAWFHVQNGKLIHSRLREAAASDRPDIGADELDQDQIAKAKPPQEKTAAKSDAATEQDWVKPMRKVHTGFQGQPGYVAQLGDSITYSMAFWTPIGWDEPQPYLKEDDGLPKTPPGKRWRDLIQGERDKGPKHGNYSGWTVKNVLGVIDSVLKSNKPEMAIIMVGTNDISGGSVPKSYEADLEKDRGEVLGGALRADSQYHPTPQGSRESRT